ncbi:CoA transferase [Vulcanisaeta sp. JCM 14467]|uniref:CoA transferase n=1 Tax=Vulcanisaeta sp. JCM 14467 TaxID=1295370 RepID=UPI0020929820|nr:CoA transferase [Vulcanisaeta sp. JCM 14467]
MGAEVVKVESPEGDMTKSWGHVIGDGVSTYYLAMNRNKHVIKLECMCIRRRSSRLSVSH